MFSHTTCKKQQKQSSFQMKLLKPSDLDEVLKLQQDVYDALPEEKKNFIVLKKKEQYETFLKNKQVIGVFVEGVYLGHLIASSPMKETDLTNGVDDLSIELDQSVYIQNVLVSPQAQGYGLMSFMMEKAISAFEKSSLKEAWAEVAAYNEPSLRGFLSKGFEIVGATRDLDDGCPLYFLRLSKNKKPANDHPTETEKACLDKDFDKVAKKLKTGKVIESFCYKTKKILWRP